MEYFVSNLQSYLAGNSLMAFPAAFLAGLLISFAVRLPDNTDSTRIYRRTNSRRHR